MYILISLQKRRSVLKLLTKVNIKLTGIISIFITILFLGNIVFLDYNLDKNIEYTCMEHYNSTLRHLNNTFEALLITTESISNNDNIINVLENNKSFDDLTEAEIEQMKSHINAFEGLIKSLSFVNTINISSLKGDYLFSKGIFYEDFNVNERPWFRDEYMLYNQQEPIVSAIHKDFNSDKETFSILSFVNSPEDSSLIGVVILDIYIEDLLDYINNSYYIGSVDSYIRFNNGDYYGRNGLGNPVDKSGEDIYTVRTDNIANYNQGRMDLIIEYDINSISYTESFQKFKNFQTLFYSIFGVLLSIILVMMVRIIFNPIRTTVNRFKSLIESKDQDIFDQLDEFKQLESIADTLSISFNQKIQTLIYHDELTKLPNRKQLYKITNNLIKYSKEFAIIFIDINKFKQINDLLGHLVGDALLKVFSDRLKNAIGTSGIVTRYSGDEFIIVYTDYTTDDELKKFYDENIITICKDSIEINNNKINIDFSSGVSIYPKDGATLDELIKNSDFIMYKNKNNKDKQELLFFNDEVYKNIVRIEDIKRELKNAVNNKELVLYYQPILDKHHITRKVEVLLRWQNEKLGFVSPLDFIGYAEETGDIVQIGYWIIEEVCKNYNELNGSISLDLKVNINVSPIQLMKSDFVEKVNEIILSYNMPHRLICFEITESVFLEENATVVNNLNELSRLGFKIALDDFGTGYSSFSYLKKFKLDTLKLDKMFITNASEIDYKIIENIKNIAVHLDMDVVAEGVEDIDQFDRLQKIDCDLFQGFYFSKPLKFSEIKEFLNKE